MDANDRLGDYLRRVGIGPRGSKDLTRDEARDAMAICLSRQASDTRIGAFLLAARLKRETEAEQLGFLDALREAAEVVTAPVPAVVDLADPYDGAVRHPPLGLFVAATLGACGLPAVVHGVPDQGPKHGVTHERVARVLGLDVDLPAEPAARRLVERGWTYLSARRAQPALVGLDAIRDAIVKRPALALLEKLVLPIRGADVTHAAAGYVHSGYDVLMRALAGEAVGAAEAIVWTAAAILWGVGEAEDLSSGVEAARAAVSSGRALAALEG